MWKEKFGWPIGVNRQIFWFGFGFHLFRTARASSIRVDLKSGERGMCAVVRKAVRADRQTHCRDYYIFYNKKIVTDFSMVRPGLRSGAGQPARDPGVEAGLQQGQQGQGQQVPPHQHGRDRERRRDSPRRRGRSSSRTVSRRISRSPSGSRPSRPGSRRTASRWIRSRSHRSRSTARGSSRRTSRARSRARRSNSGSNPRRRSRRESISRSRVSGHARSRARQSTSPGTLKKRVQDLTTTVKRLERKQKEEYEFKNTGLAKQADFLRKMSDWMEDGLRVKLEEELGPVPQNLLQVISAGESLLEDRLHLLKIADTYGWSAVAEFTATDLARDEAEEKKLKKIAKEKEAKQAKLNERKWAAKKKLFGQVESRGFRYLAGAKDLKVKEISAGTQEREEMTGGKKTGSATSARDLGTSQETAKERAVTAQDLVEDEEVELDSEEAIDVDFMRNKCKNGAERLDNWEGINCTDYDFVEELEGVPVEKVESGIKVVDSLRDKVEVWIQHGAGKMVQQIISSGLRLNFNKKLPTFYRESNNKSYKNNEEFGIEEIRKFLLNEVIEEVEAKEVLCINPLTVASNKKGKKRLCIDLSRHVNLSCVAKKFKVESVEEFIRTVKQGSWCWYYDLKSAFHHISIIEKHRKYLGFEVTIDGQSKVFRFKAMPFGYKDASRILTKLMRTPICSWRKAGIPSFIHIDDGLGFKASEEEAVEAAKRVKKDLESLGLVTSVEKCQWQPVQKFEWCGFFWDLVEFRVRVTEDKKQRIKSMAAKLLGQSLVSARELAALSGLIISCAPATGRNARFYTRFSVGWCQALVDSHSWDAKDMLTEEVIEELKFWKERLDEFDSQLIRHSAGVFEYYVCSDSGEFFIGGTVTYKGKEQTQKRFQISLEKWERMSSSTYRELRSIECGLRLIGPEVRGQVVRYGNDNFAACKVVEFGSTKKDCHMVACRVAALVEEFDIKLEMVWRRRNTQEISLCDRLSKDFDLSEYRISRASFEEIEEEYGPWQIDWFASDWSRRMDRFASRYWTIGTDIIDAFSQDWSLYVGFFHPPLSEVARVMEKIEIDKAKGVVIVPDWPGSEVDSIMMQAKRVVELLDIKQMTFESPDWRDDDTFRGLSGFGIRIYRTIF